MVAKQALTEVIGLSEAVLEGSQRLSKSQFQYDFPGLILKLTVFFALSYTIAKFFEAVIFGQNTLVAFLNLIGVKLPSSLPESIVNFFQDGIQGFKYWDFIKMFAILLVLYEWFNWYNSVKGNPKNPPSPMTQGVFVVLIAGLSLVTFPELIQRIRELRVMNKDIEVNK